MKGHRHRPRLDTLEGRIALSGGGPGWDIKPGSQPPPTIVVPPHHPVGQATPVKAGWDLKANRKV